MSGNIKFRNNCEAINADIAPLVQQAIINELKETYPTLEVLPIGSVGKKNEPSGDIDIAIKCQDIDVLYKIISNTFNYLDTVKMESLYIVSIAYPYQITPDSEIKYVQCDFMNVWSFKYTAFRYYCPDYKKQESRYKVGQKIMFANMLFNHIPKEVIALPEHIRTKYDFRPTALFRYEYNINTSETVERYITMNPDMIALMCFSDGDTSHFNSVETIWKAIHSEVYKYPEEVKIIEKNFFVNCWRKGWTNIVPEDFKLQYWTNDEIWKFMNEQNKINKINTLINKLTNMENK